MRGEPPLVVTGQPLTLYFYETTPGAISRTVLTDTNGDERFATRETTYDGTGTPVSLVTEYDTGQVRGIREELAWSGGWVIHKTTVTDVDSGYSFDQVVTNYSATGVLTDRTTVYDAAVVGGPQNVLTQTYQPDGARTDVLVDNASQSNFATSTTSFDAAGRATGASATYDNGNTWTGTYYPNGTPQRSVITDANDDEAFQTITTNFSPTAAGQTESTVYLFDNGTSWINGSAIDNTLVGGATNDIITGYDGNDTMTGGAGADMFWYNGTGWGNDVITDFQLGIDQIDLRGVSGAHPLSLLTVQSGADTVISYTNGATTSTITLQNVTATSLVPRDVLV